MTMRIYLDQNKWIDLLLAASGDERGRPYGAAHDALLAAIFAGTASCPLSSVHLSETWRIRDNRRRHQLALVMVKFSQRNAIAPIGSLLGPEIEQALHRQFGRPAQPTPLEPFGVGVAFATGLNGTGIQETINSMAADEAVMAEFAVVAGGDMTDDLAAESAARHATGRKYGAVEEGLGQQLHAHKYQKYGSTRAFVSLANQLVENDLITALIGSGIAPDEFQALGADGCAALLADIPSLWAITTLRLRKHSNPQHGWNAHDLNDLKALSVAGAYCDVIIAEKSWTGLMRSAGFTKRFGTRLVTDVRDLPQLLNG
jgi:hypothetical protein